ncbi:Serpentine Receptor, class H [Caenorhabditis elegans]|uniref:Serpentine Receptor, class H n=1 Tax=Caenorhabditis elegans TaxID=6239 RepID=O16978_CAEEL|nr:Serpentine Receptor, class H [Caenorhabditis elegans]CCD71814.1 Serpentine Receptor, class H [Caenorhabditis elegans]|eukprot:NP_503764.1 Serpentine Receptor, class H [Caenorhabditis elegans]
MNKSRSIWNENPDTYFDVKFIYSSIITLFYPFAHFCVLRKSPKNFGILKWIIYIHTVCFTVEWLLNAFLIDMFDFQPSVVLRIDGFLKNSVDAVVLYEAYLIAKGVTETSWLILFTGRLLLIFDLYRPTLSFKRKCCELIVYLIVAILGFWVTPMMIFQLPEQNSAKLKVMMIEQFYPDCLWSPTAIIVTSAETFFENFLCVLIIVNYCSIGLAIYISAKIAFWVLSKRMETKSDATKKMHKKFNDRTIFQTFLFFAFCCIPFSVLFITILLDFYIPGITYFVDFLSENHPTVCLISLFLYYDPYQYFFLELIGFRAAAAKPRLSSIPIGRRSTVTRGSIATFTLS